MSFGLNLIINLIRLEPLTFRSQFNPNITIAVVLSEHPQYEQLKPMFDEYGYGFMVPGRNLIIIDGEQFVDNFNSDVLKFIEAHEVAHFILDHDGPRNDEEEMDADLGAYLLLKKIGANNSIKLLVKHFRNRHGIKFDEKLLDRVIKSF
jgi:hypothetical protein